MQAQKQCRFSKFLNIISMLVLCTCFSASAFAETITGHASAQIMQSGSVSEVEVLGFGKGVANAQMASSRPARFLARAPQDTAVSISVAAGRIRSLTHDAGITPSFGRDGVLVFHVSALADGGPAQKLPAIPQGSYAVTINYQ